MCECGGMTHVITHDLKTGHTRSCGCAKRIATSKRNTTHGLSNVPEYKVWKSILNRTENKNEPAYRRYGARGIVMCDAWKDDFGKFYAYMGQRPSAQHSVERINNDVGYEPGNVVWALPKDQANNRSSNINVEFNGKVRTVQQWCDDLNLGIAYGTVMSRIKRGWPTDRAFYQPVDTRRVRKLRDTIKQTTVSV